MVFEYKRRNFSAVENSQGIQTKAGFPILALCSDIVPQFPEIMIEEELIELLRIPKVSGAKDYHNAIENLKRMRGLPTLSLCNKVLYPKKAVLEWVDKNTKHERG